MQGGGTLSLLAVSVCCDPLCVPAPWSCVPGPLRLLFAETGLSLPDFDSAQQTLRAGERLGEEEQEAAAATAEEHGRARRGAGAAADPLREGGHPHGCDRDKSSFRAST